MIVHRFMFTLHTNWVNISVNTFKINNKTFADTFYINVREVYKEEAKLVI